MAESSSSPPPPSDHEKQQSSPVSPSMEEYTVGATPDMQNAAMQIERGREVYSGYGYVQDKPSKFEIWGWYLYGWSSYFVLTLVLPVLFPLIISEVSNWPDDGRKHVLFVNLGYNSSVACNSRQLHLYQSLTQRLITVNNLKFSALEWTSISWIIGIILSCPLIPYISTHLDHFNKQQLITGAATGIGSLLFLPVGFFQTTRIFPFYIAIIVTAYIVASASHTRHLGLMVNRHTGSVIQTNQFRIRRGVSSWFSLISTLSGCLGSAVMSAFTYYMLRKRERFVSLWVVSIFSGLKWLLGMIHVASVRPGLETPPSKNHFLSIFKYPHAIGTLVVVFLSSFTTMCIFSGGVLYLVGKQCLTPIFVLLFWLIYFIFPSFSLLLSQPLQHFMRSNAVKMQLIGFFITVLTSALGTSYKDKHWERQHVLVFGGIQSTSAGLLYAYGRVLLLDCSPHGKEGAFSMWYSWVKTLGSCVGFLVATSMPGNIYVSFRIAFGFAIVGIFVLIFGNVSDYGGAKAAGIVEDESDLKKGSPVSGLDVPIKQQSLQEGIIV